jgi:hypothetical protein
VGGPEAKSVRIFSAVLARGLFTDGLMSWLWRKRQPECRAF